MAVTEKISVALGRDELRLARTAAEQDGVSLSAFVTGAVRARIEERRRLEAARQVLATFEPEDFPTAEEQRDLLALWASPRAVPARQKPRRQRR
ncbi:MAG: hypothetical protein E6J90_52530 [Deltaproteobacteria bacterium]|nr:MAG: hypothetical protein E6J90_52530 [Deltaproteobacteria bacterium]TMQ21667.1 MAG: hypothetical protein E6J91_02245 [Deltaproteobacteria bacterium]